MKIHKNRKQIKTNGLAYARKHLKLDKYHSHKQRTGGNYYFLESCSSTQTPGDTS